MFTKIINRAIALTLMCAGSLVGACAPDPVKAKQEYLTSGNRYFDEKKYTEAILQYRNALQQDNRFGEARFKLAQSYEAIGDVPNAVREFIRAADALPDDATAQWKAGTMLLLSGQFQEARERAEKALAISPEYADAEVLLGNALTGLKDFDSAVREIEEAIKVDPSAAAFTSLGIVQAVRGKNEDAEAAYRKAIQASPQNVVTHLSLAQFLWATGRAPEAEASMRDALKLEPGNLLAHRALATLYLSTNRAPEAEPHLKALADADTSSSARSKLALADYYVAVNRPDDAKRLLEDIAKSRDAFSAARTRTALLDYQRKDPVEANRVIDEVLVKDPKNVQALLTKANFLIADQKLEEAEARAKAAVAADSRSLQAHYLLGTIYRTRGMNDEAIAAFTEVLKINSRVAAAQLQLAQLNLAKGSEGPALQMAQDAAKALPGDPTVRLTLVNSLIANGDLMAADRELQPLSRALPTAPGVLNASGRLAYARRQYGPARVAYEKANAADPNSHEALAGLVGLDLVEKKPDAATARIERRLAAAPADTRAMMLGVRVYGSQGDLKRTEELLRTVIETDANDFDAYITLARLYQAQRRTPEARARLEAILDKKPNAIGPLTMIGMLFEVENNLPEAQKKYEQVVQIDREAPVAANNLAYLYADRGGNLDLALQLAQVARQKLPDRPEVADTVGWVYLKRGMAGLAIPPLEDAVKADPKNATYAYHLGVALAQAGEKARARRMLETAISLNLDPASAEEARKLAAK